MCPIAAGNWNNAANAGAWALYLVNVRSGTDYYVGLRADSVSPHRLHFGHSGIKGDAFRRVVKATAKSACFRLSGRAEDRLEGLAT